MRRPWRLSPEAVKRGRARDCSRRVGLALPAEGGHLPVARHEVHLITQRPKPFRNRLDQLRVIATRESVRPIEPLNSTSPTKAISLSPRNKDNMPGVCPGQWRAPDRAGRV